MCRVCSALPGSTVYGMGAPRARHYGPAIGNGAPSIPVPADPRRRHCPELAAMCVNRLMTTALIQTLARVGAARAERAEGRSGARGVAGKRARRSGAQPGLELVERL
ncbi:hypothetical protein GCM10018789_51160 [Streptomyces werraensis]|nr:hypothetical protein GCM10018789_51160 [Streptomyces werraensis]